MFLLNGNKKCDWHALVVSALYQRSVSLVLGLHEFGLLMVGRHLWRHLGTPKAKGVPLSGYAIMSRVRPLAFILFVLSFWKSAVALSLV